MSAVLSPPRKKAVKKTAPTIKPFAHQLKSLAHAKTTPIVFDTSDPGTGKTYVRIKAYEFRKNEGACLVLAPKSLLKSTWLDDIKKFAPALRAVVSVAGKHEQVFAEDADVYITNIDAVNWLAKQPKKFFAKFSELVVDESAAFKHHTSMRSRAIAKIARYFKYRTCMTGTPNSNSITDVWHQVKILDDGKRLGPSFYAFREATCTATQVGPSPHALRWADKDGAEEAVFGLLSDIVIRHKFEDCVDIPPNHQYCISYELTPKARKAYDEMEANCILMIYGEEEMDRLTKARLRGVPYRPVPKSDVTALNAGVLATKLLQIASGAVYESAGGKYHVIDTGRYEMILDLAEQTKHSLGFFFWRHQRDLLLAEAEKRGMTYAVIDGATPSSERSDIVERYQRGMYQILFAHPKSAAHGLTLTRGTRTIWPCPTADLELFKQGSKRLHRMGQSQKTETIVVVAKNTREERLYNILTNKAARLSNLLDWFSNI